MQPKRVVINLSAARREAGSLLANWGSCGLEWDNPCTSGELGGGGSSMMASSGGEGGLSSEEFHQWALQAALEDLFEYFGLPVPEGLLED